MVREHDKPTFGICLGMQCMVIEYARNVLGLKDANSTEMNPQTPYNVIDLMEEQKSISNMGGTMRLGAYDCVLKPVRKRLRLTAQHTSASVIATALNSTRNSASNLRTPA